MLTMLKRTIMPRLRAALSSNLNFNSRVNAFFGHIGDHSYRTLVAESENIDSLVEVDAVQDLRTRATNVAYPDRIESVNRIYGIKNALFGPAFEEVGTPSVEHGIFLGDYIYPADTVYTSAPTVVTFSNYRKVIIQRHQQLPVFPVGPYIRYASPHYDDRKIQEIRAAQGRTALVFPTHTTEDSRIDGSIRDKFSWISKLRDEFDTVMVCMFWWDLLPGVVDHFRSEGLNVVCCGLTHDRNFLSRQKTLFRLADVVFGDGAGTHIGYAISEGVPFRLLSDKKIEFDLSSRSWLREGLSSLEENSAELLAKLSASTEDMLQQREAVSSYWGLSASRSLEELRLISEISRDIALRSRGATRHYLAVARDLINSYSKTDELKRDLLISAMPERAL